jgi:hypothetical protein
VTSSSVISGSTPFPNKKKVRVKKYGEKNTGKKVRKKNRGKKYGKKVREKKGRGKK